MTRQVPAVELGCGFRPQKMSRFDVRVDKETEKLMQQRSIARIWHLWVADVMLEEVLIKSAEDPRSTIQRLVRLFSDSRIIREQAVCLALGGTSILRGARIQIVGFWILVGDSRFVFSLW